MSTHSVVAYKTESGEVRGTYVHFDGYPSNMIPALEKRFKERGYKGSVKWIEEGIEGGGYDSVDDIETLGCIHLRAVDDEEFGYMVTQTGVKLAYSIY